MSNMEMKAARLPQPAAEYAPVIVIGGGQAGLSVGYHLARRGIRFLILDAAARVGDAWRQRWDSLRLFSPAQFDGLDGRRFPAPAGSFPTKDSMADYLADYARHFRLPLRSGVRVDGLWHADGGYLLSAGDARYRADQVAIAMSGFQQPSLPTFARDLDPAICQLHAADYRNPDQLRRGPVLVAGAGNSGAEIAVELAADHRVWLAGPDVGEIPFRMESFWGRHVQARVVLRGVFHRLLTTATPMGRKARAAHGPAPLIRTRSAELRAAGVTRVPRMIGVEDGRPKLEDGSTPDVANLVWCTGFHTDFSWIDLPIFDADGAPRHVRGVVDGEAGLYFVGLPFLYAMSSTMVHGVGRDARHVVGVITDRISAPANSDAAFAP